ncbi:MAG: hydratase, partial [Lachnospiraceae bacterium]|nr:hydratase [Lachnospiraceae bacterium]
MIKLYDTGAYLLNGSELVCDDADAKSILESKGINTTKEEASQNTMAYNILKAHNTSENMEQLKIKFDKMTSHDITFVGIIQTARASGLTEFPIPYVLTNCHNSLCA